MEYRDTRNNNFNRGNLWHNDFHYHYKNDGRSSGQRSSFDFVENKDDSKRSSEKKPKLEGKDLELAMLKKSLILKIWSYN